MDKHQVIAKLHKRLNKTSRKIDELALQTHLGKAEAKAAFDERIQELEHQRSQFRDEVHHLKHLSSTAWEDLAEGCESSWFEMKTALRKAVDEFKS